MIRTALGKMEVADNLATAQVLIDNQVAPNRFQFSKEDGIWKFDLIHVIHDTDRALKAAVKQSGVSENEFIFSLIEILSGKKIDDTIWTPIH